MPLWSPVLRDELLPPLLAVTTSDRTRLGPLAAAGAAWSLSWRIFGGTISAKYRRSFLGYFWMVAPALLVTGGVMLAADAGVLRAATGGLPQPLAVFLGTLLWMVFAEAVEVPHQAFASARSYLTRVHFSRAAIVLAQLHESLLTTGVRVVAALGAAMVFGPGLGLGGAVLLVTAFVAAIALGVGIGCLVMPFTQLFADLQQTMKLVLGYGLFLTPAMYEPRSGWFATLVACNPVTPLIDGARQAVAGEALAQPILFAAMLVAGLVATALGLLLVRAVAPILIERMLLGGR